MTAAEFFHERQREGRAVLQSHATHHDAGNWGDDGRVPLLWLARVFRRLLLCRDHDPVQGADNVVRFVGEDEFVELGEAGYRLTHHVIEG